MIGHQYKWLAPREEKKEAKQSEAPVPIIPEDQGPIHYWTQQLQGLSVKDAATFVSILLKARAVYSALLDVLSSVTEEEVPAQSPALLSLNQLKACLSQAGFLTQQNPITKSSTEDKITALNNSIDVLAQAIDNQSLKDSLGTANEIIKTFSLLTSTLLKCKTISEQNSNLSNSGHVLTLVTELAGINGLFQFQNVSGALDATCSTGKIFTFFGNHQKFFEYQSITQYIKDAALYSRKVFLLKELLPVIFKLHQEKSDLLDRKDKLIAALRSLSSNEPWTDSSLSSWRLDLYNFLEAMLNDPHIFPMLHNLIMNLSIEYAEKMGAQSGAAFSAGIGAITTPLTSVLQLLQYIDAPSNLTKAAFSIARIFFNRIDSSGSTTSALHLAEMTTHWFQVSSWISFITAMPAIMPTILSAASADEVRQLLKDRDFLRETLKTLFQMTLFNEKELEEFNFNPSQSADRTLEIITFQKINEHIEAGEGVRDLASLFISPEAANRSLSLMMRRYLPSGPEKKPAEQPKQKNRKKKKNKGRLDHKLDAFHNKHSKSQEPTPMARALNTALNGIRDDKPHLHIPPHTLLQKAVGKSVRAVASSVAYAKEKLATTKPSEIVQPPPVEAKEPQAPLKDLNSVWNEKKKKAEESKKILNEKGDALFEEIKKIECPEPTPETLEKKFAETYQKIKLLHDEIEIEEKKLDCYQARIVFKNKGLDFRKQTIQSSLETLLTKTESLMLAAVQEESEFLINEFKQKTLAEQKEIMRSPMGIEAGRAIQFVEDIAALSNNEVSSEFTSYFRETFHNTAIQGSLAKKIASIQADHKAQKEQIHQDLRKKLVADNFELKITEIQQNIDSLAKKNQDSSVEAKKSAFIKSQIDALKKDETLTQMIQSLGVEEGQPSVWGYVTLGYGNWNDFEFKLERDALKSRIAQLESALEKAQAEIAQLPSEKAAADKMEAPPSEEKHNAESKDAKAASNEANVGPESADMSLVSPDVPPSPVAAADDQADHGLPHLELIEQNIKITTISERLEHSQAPSTPSESKTARQAAELEAQAIREKAIAEEQIIADREREKEKRIDSKHAAGNRDADAVYIDSSERANPANRSSVSSAEVNAFRSIHNVANNSASPNPELEQVERIKSNYVESLRSEQPGQSIPVQSVEAQSTPQAPQLQAQGEQNVDNQERKEKKPPEGEEKKYAPHEEANNENASAVVLDIFTRYESILNNIDQNTEIFKNKAELLSARKTYFQSLATDEACTQFRESLEKEYQLLLSFTDFNTVLEENKNKDPLVKNEGDIVYQYSADRLYKLLKKLPSIEKDITFLNTCIEDATGAIRYQGTFTAKRYIENLMEDATLASNKSTWKRRLASKLAALAGAVIIGLSFAGISVPLWIGIGLIALGGINIFNWIKSRPLADLAKKAKNTLPLIPSTPSHYRFPGPRTNVLIPEQKNLLKRLIQAIQSDQFPENLIQEIYEATLSNTPEGNKTLRYFIEQHIVPYLSDQELFLLTREVMTYAQKLDTDILRKEETLTRALYTEFAERMMRKNYSPNGDPQPPSMIILNKIVYQHMLDQKKQQPLDDAVTAITFKLNYLSMKRDKLRASLTAPAPFSSGLSDEKHTKEKRITKLNSILSEKSFLPVEEKKGERNDLDTAIKQLDAINEIVTDMKQDKCKEAVTDFVQIASTYLPLANQGMQNHLFFDAAVKHDLNQIYKALISRDTAFTVPLYDLSKKLIDRKSNEHEKYHEKTAFCLAQIALNKIGEIDKLLSLYQEAESLINTHRENPIPLAKITFFLIIAARAVAEPEKAKSLRDELDAIDTSNVLLMDFQGKVEAFIPSVIRPNP